MGYRLGKGDPLSEGLKRISRHQIDGALAQIDAKGADRDSAIHDIRKRFKKVRAVLRLVRDEIGKEVYQRENQVFRDAGRLLAPVRESAVRPETVDKLACLYSGEETGAFRTIKKNLQGQHRTIMKEILDKQNALAEVGGVIQQARARVEDWPIENNRFEAIAPGIHRVYLRGWKAMPAAYDDPTPENFHEWRKRAKYLWYHIRILRPLWPEMMKAFASELDKLGDLLGDDHDLHDLRRTLSDKPELAPRESQRKTLLVLIERQCHSLRRNAWVLGRRIYADDPDAFAKRLETCWSAMEEERESDGISS